MIMIQANKNIILSFIVESEKSISLAISSFKIVFKKEILND